MSLGATLTRLRQEKKESLQDVADAIGSSKTHVWELEKGRATNPSMDLLKKLADHFDVTVEVLVGNADIDQGKATAFFRDFTSLAKEDQEIVRATIERLKKRPG
jgi:transcriptional regulator with XRE-family HTH domain